MEGLLYFDVDTKRYAISDNLAQLLQIDSNSSSQDMIYHSIVEEDKERYQLWATKVLGGNKSDKIELKLKNNQKGITVQFSKNLQSPFVKVFSVTDTSEIALPSFLQDNVNFNQIIQEVSDYAILFLNKDGYIQNWNKGVERIKHFKSEDIIGKHISIFYSKEDIELGLPQQLLKEADQKGRAEYEGWRIRKGGDTFWGYVVLNSIYNSDNELIGYAKVTRDLTEKKNYEDSLVEQAEIIHRHNQALSDINRELQEFAYKASHDLKEPLRKIRMFMERIEEEEASNLSEQGRDYFNRVRAAVIRMKRLIDDMLSYAQTNHQQKPFVRLTSNELRIWLEGEFREAIEHSGVELNWKGDAELIGVEYQIKQILSNLVSNSIKFARKDVPLKIEIETSYTKGQDNGNVYGQNGVTYSYLKYMDNGIGFEPEYNTSIFELLYRLHGRGEYEGSGIGLSICKRIAELHEGRIYAEGIPNQGAIFHLFLPLVNTQ